MTYTIPNLPEIIEDSIGNDSEIVDYKTIRFTGLGENYGSLMLGLDVDIKNKKDNSTKTIKTVAKLLPALQQFRDIFNVNVTFVNEIEFYKTIIPTLEKYTGSKEIEYFPKMLGAYYKFDEKKSLGEDTVIILENLKVEGYDSADRLIGYNQQESEAILRTIGNFHARGIALKLNFPEVFKKNVEPYINVKFTGDPNSSRDKHIERIHNFIVKSLGADHPLTRKALKHMKEIEAMQPELNAKEPFITIAHSDFWGNNIMVKAEETGSTKVKILDFQGCRYSSPASDVIFFLMTSVKNDVFSQNFDDFIKVYYKSFVESLRDLNVDTAKYSFEAFEEELHYWAKYEIEHCIFFANIILKPKQQQPSENQEHLMPEDIFLNLSEDSQEKIRLVLSKYDEKKWI